MGTAAANPRVSRHFVTIDGTRQIHYLRAGSGAPVLILHPSPGPSRYLLSLIEYLSDHFTVFAPDTPGNGLSDPLPLDAPTMDDYGDNVARVLDALGIDKIALYGFHTGASVGTAFAIRHPQRVRGAILDGFLVESDASLKDRLSHYLLPFEPKLDGSHMTWLWTRLRDQRMYGKWYAPSLASRFDLDAPTPAATHGTVMDWLDAGAAYIKPYSAAFRQRGHLQVMRLTTPTVICAADSDSLVHHLDALPPNLPACVAVKRMGGKDNVNAFVLAELRGLAAGSPPPVPAVPPLSDRAYQSYVTIPGGQLHVRRSDAGTGRPLVILHDAIGDNRVVDGITLGFHGRRPAVAIDLPGHGNSDNTLGANVSLQSYARTVDAALDALGLREVDVLGVHAGTAVATELALRSPARVKQLILAETPPLDRAVRAALRANYAYPIDVEFFGGHLLKAWFTARDQGHFWPWYERSRAAAVMREPYSAAEVHLRMVAILKAGAMFQRYAEAAFTPDAAVALAQVKAPIIFAAAKGSPLAASMRATSGTVRGAQAVDLPPDMKNWAAALLPFVGG